MYKFVNIKKSKKTVCLSREKEIEEIEDHIRNKRAFCVYGMSGVGKTHLVKHCLENKNFLEVDGDYLKNKNFMIDFFERFRGNKSIIFFDNFEWDFQLCKEFFEIVCSEDSPFSSSVIMCSTSDKSVLLCDSVYVSSLPDSVLFSLAKRHRPSCDPTESVRLCRGNIYNLYFYLDCKVSKDVFYTTKDYMKKILTSRNILSDLDKYIQDHGYSCGVVHDNYVDTNNLDLDRMCEIADSFSIADMYDNMMYIYDWNFIDYFTYHGIINPVYLIDGNIDKSKEIRPGSCWTKYNNYKTRKNKLNNIKVDQQYFRLLMTYGEKYLKSYKIIPCDLDVMNHTFLYNKFKYKEITKLKKTLVGSSSDIS